VVREVVVLPLTLVHLVQILSLLQSLHLVAVVAQEMESPLMVN
jgi:hypothetical protein